MAVKRTKGEADDGKKNPLAKDAPDRKVPQQEKDEVKKVLKQIERAKTLTKTFNETTLPTLRRQMAGTYKADSDETNVRTNLIFATAATLLPHIYAKNPEISVSPSESVDDSEYEMIRQLCKASQIAVNKLLVEEAKLKPRIKSGIRSTMTTSVGWFKLSYQQSLSAGDPIILRRANDVQDNLRQVEWLIHSADGTTDPTELNQKREEIKQQMQGIMSGDEVKTFKGFTLDRVKTEDMFILDESITEFDEYVDAKKIAHRVWMTDDEFEASFGFKCPQSATKYGQPAATEATDEQGSKIQNGGDESGVCYRAVFEVWDKTTNLVSAVCEGAEGYCSYPHAMTASPERWYPFYALGFNILEGRWRPLSDVELLQKLQDEYNTTRYLYAEARKEAIPIRVFRKAGGLTEEDINALMKRKARDWQGIEGSPTIPLNQEIVQLEGVKIDPQAYDVTIIRNDMDMMVGLSDASRSNLIQAKTATEAEIMKQALMTRVAERQDSVEDMVSQMALAVLQMAMEVFSKAEIEQLCGKGAGAAWPEATGREEIFRKLRVQVKAGSSGKPNLMKERESWATIMPVIQKTMEQVTAMRLQGQFDLAQSMIELLKETLQRYDEKIDVERFIPKQEVGEDGQPVNDPRMQAMQQVEQLKQQMEEMGQELQQCKDALQQCQMDLKIAKQAQDARIAEAESNRAIETARETSRDNDAARKEEAKRQAAAADAETKRAAAVREVELKDQADTEKNRNEFASKAYQVAVSAAAQIIAKRLEPKVGADGQAQASEDLSAEAIGDAIATIVARVMPQSGEIGMQMVKHPSREQAEFLPQMMAGFLDRLDGMTAALSRPVNKRVVLGANGLPERLVVDNQN